MQVYDLVKADDGRWYIEVGAFSATEHNWVLLTPNDAVKVATDLLIKRLEYEDKRKGK